MRSLLSNLAFQVLLAIVAGIAVGHYFPATGIQSEVIGNTFVSILKLFIGPIIFLTITLGIAGIGNLKKVGRVGMKALIYFELVTTLALLIGIGVALIIKPGEIDKAGLSVQDVSVLKNKADEGFNWIRFFTANFTLQVLVAAIISGVIISHLSKREQILQWLEKVAAIVYKLLRYVMYLAPLGAFGGIAFAVGKFGWHSLVPLAKLMVCVYITMALFIFFVLGTILRFYRIKIINFLKVIKEEVLIVLATSSSEAALPSLMKKLENMGCSKPVVGLVVPTGYSFNLDGTSIYLSMAVLFIAQLYGIQLSLGELASVLGILMITSKGAAGVTGSGFIVLASTLTAIHKIPVEGLAFLLGVDKFMSEARAITNIIGNGVATLVISKSEEEFEAGDEANLP
ncbi:MAG: cation:dicarboxylase symporter family transporter [Bacteroidetes bacterium]|nr:cation:dicarboxylase symporter family transporter [Bacteroidota bacterium]MBS1541242.1 cation:dicarboxylase symporter family transporter [Bacteroidota bacterium]